MQPRILIFDVETAPLTAYTWGIHDQNISLGQVKQDWHFLAWAAKWLGEPANKVIYMDNNKAKNVRDDKALILGLWKLLDQADIVIAQNGDRFDIKKFNARAVIHGLTPVSPFKSVDTLKESRKVFGFTAHSLEYMSDVLNTKYKKLKHNKYPGFELWKAILNGDKKAWAEMKTYCIHDVLATEELYTKIQGWIKTQNLATYYDDLKLRCHCGSSNLHAYEIRRLASGHFQGYRCRDCGKRLQGKTNLLSLEKRKTLLKGITHYGR